MYRGYKDCSMHGFTTVTNGKKTVKTQNKELAERIHMILRISLNIIKTKTVTNIHVYVQSCHVEHRKEKQPTTYIITDRGRHYVDEIVPPFTFTSK